MSALADGMEEFMAGEKCQVCGGRVVNGRCSLCGMPYRNDEVLYHLNESRETHYEHASKKAREMMRGYSSMNGKNLYGAETKNNRTETAKQRGTVNPTRNASRAKNINQTRPVTPMKTVNPTGSINSTRAVNPTRTATSARPVNQGKDPSGNKRSKGKGWIIWLIIILFSLLPEVMDAIREWIGSNL